MIKEILGQRIKLVPLADIHFDTLQTLVLAHPELYRFTTMGSTRPSYARWFTLAQQQNAWVVVRLADNTPIGSTRLYHLNKHIGSVAVGYTWYAPDCLGTGINTEVKYLLLSHAFETLNCHRVQFDINAENSASRKAVEKLGAQCEGVLRQSRRMTDGQLADYCVYGLLAHEWKITKQNLVNILYK